MKAPDKIYIGTVTLSSNAPSEEHLLPDWHLKPNPKVANIEYIRKDALIEWAEKKKNDVKKFGQRYNEANYYNSGCHNTIQELIDKLNEL